MARGGTACHNSGRGTIEANELHRRLIGELSNAGCFQPAPLRSAAFGALILACYSSGYAILLADPGIGVRAAAIALLAFFSVQAGFVAHEAGHGALTRHRRLATLVGHVFHTFLTGLSSSYFRRIHGLHHPHCNDRGRDPDMQSEFVSMHRHSALVGRLRQVYQPASGSPRLDPYRAAGVHAKARRARFRAAQPRRTRADQLCLVLHFGLWLVPPALVLGIGAAALNYALMTVLIGFYVGSIFVVNHVGTRVVEPDERLSMFEQELSVTRNLGTSRLQDFVFGGLNNHIEHHLFPSMPTARLRRARRITREFCRRHGIAYREMSWVEAAREVTRHFKAMSAFVPS